MRDQSHWGLPAERLERRFTDKKPAFDGGEARIEAARCLYCCDAPCISACPTRIDIPTFIRKIATGNLRGSARTILRSNLLGRSCAVVCPVEVLCEGACVYVGWGRKPVEIGRLQRFATESAQSADLLEKAPSTGKSVALVGGGPASLACAGTLALQGHRTVIFEKNDLPGGLNVSGVAPYKLQAETALEEVEFIRQLGVEIRTGIEVGATDASADADPSDGTADRVPSRIAPTELLEGFDAVFLGLGLGDDSLRGIPGAEGPGVVGAIEWIRAMKLDPKASVAGVASAVVVGGGNTALDVVQELASLGVAYVHLVYRRSEGEMPGYTHEWEGGKKLKVRLTENAVVREIHRREDGTLERVALDHAAKGRSTGESIGSIGCDLLVIATGQERLEALARQFPGVACDSRGRVVADPQTMATGNPRVFTGGDCYNGGKEVVNAAAEGQRAARAIDAMLQA